MSKYKRKWCDNYDCPLACENHPKHIPKKQKSAVFVNMAETCRRYIGWLVDETSNELRNRRKKDSK